MLNKAQIIGHLGKDPEIRSFANGGRVASFSIATTQKWKNAAGEKVEKTEWHRISVLSDALVGIVEKYVHKGDKIYIEGQLETRKWTTKDGNDAYTTEVVLRPFNSQLVMLGGKDRAQDDTATDEQQAESTEWVDKPATGGGGGFDDQIPFMRHMGSL